MLLKLLLLAILLHLNIFVLTNCKNLFANMSIAYRFHKSDKDPWIPLPYAINLKEQLPLKLGHCLKKTILSLSSCRTEINPKEGIHTKIQDNSYKILQKIPRKHEKSTEVEGKECKKRMKVAKDKYSEST